MENNLSINIFLDFYKEKDLNLSINKTKYSYYLKEYILSNIKDKDSRCLLLILLNQFQNLTLTNISYNYFIVSYFEDDIKDDNYWIEILN